MIPHPLQSAALSRPHHIALQSAHASVTYADLLFEVQALAGTLKTLGICPGDTIGLVATYDSQWVIGLHAIGWLGAVALPVPVDMPDEEILSLANRAAVKLWLADEPRATRLESVKQKVCLLSERGNAFDEERYWQLEDVRLKLATSGSTGAPRMISITTSQLLFSAMGSMIRLGHDLKDSWLCALPLHHVGGISILMRALWAVVTVELAWPFVPEHFSQRIHSGQISLCSLVPEMLRRVLQVSGEQAPPAALRAMLIGGDACPGDILEQAESFGYPVALTWGMTESASQVATRFAGDFSEHTGSGPSLGFARVHERDGALVIEGPVVQEGGLNTSDRGFVDERGCVHILGRADDIMISGGENIAPRKIEEALLQSDLVKAVAVVGVAHSRWGRRPVAFVVLADGEHLQEDAILRASLQEHLSAFEIPDAFYRVDALPQAGIGKLDRKTLSSVARDIGLGHQVKVTDRFEQIFGNITRLEGCKIDDNVDELAGAAQVALGSEDAVVKSDRSVANAGNRNLDGELLTESHRPLVVSVGVDERHAPLSVIENIGDTVAHRHEEFLEDGVAVLVNSTKESNSSAVDLIETNSDDMLKSHGCSGNQSEGICDESL